ncbi:MAG: segregation/condensation protein A [Planctomycetota bacterium]
MSELYRVHLERFDGPLDLLLHLIRRAEVDVTDIPVAEIADQFAEHLDDLERIDIDRAGEFLVMAATLAEIKSRMITRPERSEDDDSGADDGADPRADLIKQLLAYKTYRDAADELERRAKAWSLRYPTARAGVDSDEIRAAIQKMHDDVELEDLSLGDLIEAFGTVAETVNFERLGEHMIGEDDTPIELHAEDILDRLRRLEIGADKTMRLRAIFDGRSKMDVLGLFIATLELTRQRRIDVRQDPESWEITLTLRDDVEVEDVEAKATIDLAE